MPSDTRHKDAVWTVCADNGACTFDGAQLAVLMDIRDELKALNSRMAPMASGLVQNTNVLLALSRDIERMIRKMPPRKRKKKATNAK